MSDTVKRLYVIYDQVALECSDPFMANNDGVAMRSFGQKLLEVPEGLRGEFALYCIGRLNYSNMGLFETEAREIKVAMDEEQLEAASGE